MCVCVVRNTTHANICMYLSRAPPLINMAFCVSNMMINRLKRPKTLIETGNPINGTLCGAYPVGNGF